LLTFEQIKELIELVAERKLQAFELERSGFRLKIDGHAASPVVFAAPPADSTLPVAVPQTISATSAGAAPAGQPPAAAVPAGEKAALPAGTHILHSPIVGTFYRAPAPSAPSFVEAGSRVKKGQVLCIIEAMKLMNEIESDVDGVIAEIYPQNAQPVEFGEPLFAITPA
jgi:acetyl-CoA carboxylase biotin carboxyl carrier protein